MVWLRKIALAIVCSLGLATASPAADLYSIDKSDDDWVVSFTNNTKVKLIMCDSGMSVEDDYGPGRSLIVKDGQMVFIYIVDGFQSTYSKATDLDRC